MGELQESHAVLHGGKEDTSPPSFTAVIRRDEMGWFSSGPKSYEEAKQKGTSDANNGYGQANTHNWNDSARQTYENQYKWQQEQNEKRRKEGW